MISYGENVLINVVAFQNITTTLIEDVLQYEYAHFKYGKVSICSSYKRAVERCLCIYHQLRHDKTNWFFILCEAIFSNQLKCIRNVIKLNMASQHAYIRISYNIFTVCAMLNTLLFHIVLGFYTVMTVKKAFESPVVTIHNKCTLGF